MAHNIDFEALPYQFDFYQSEKFYDMLFGGYGSGKTYALVHKLLKLAAINRGLAGGILSPTTKMFKRDVLPTFEEILDAAKIPMQYKSGDGKLVIPKLNAEMWVFHGEDDGASIRGPNLAYGGINEITLVSEKAFKAFLARIRLKKAKLRQLAGSGTPEGFNHIYDFFISDPRTDADVYYGDMRHNHFVAAEYADLLTNSYDDIMQQQYVEGKFINSTSGSAVHRFSRAKHVWDKIPYDPTKPVWVSVDFNVNPFAATLFNYHSEEHTCLRGFDEVCIKNGDTWEFAEAIKEKCPGAETIVLFPDPAGNQRRTSAKNNITDIEILQTKFDDLRYDTSITVRECLLATNSFFKKNRMALDKTKCKEAIKDLEQVTLEEGKHKLNKKDHKRTHWLDGIKNMIQHEFPVIVEERAWEEYRIR